MAPHLGKRRSSRLERVGPVTESVRSREAILKALATFPDEVARVLNGRSPEILARPGRDGGWGVVEIVPHLRDWEELYLDRARAIVEHDRPFLPAYDDELWPIERDYRGQNPRQVFDHFRELRARLVNYLRAVPEAAWQRIGEHEMNGAITLQSMVNHICDHDQAHLVQMQDALE